MLVDGQLPWQLLYADALCTMPVVEAHVGLVGLCDAHVAGLAVTHARSLMGLYMPVRARLAQGGSKRARTHNTHTVRRSQSAPGITDAALEALASCTALQTLDVADCAAVTSGGLVAFLRGHGGKLREVVLNGLPLTDDLMRHAPAWGGGGA